MTEEIEKVYYIVNPAGAIHGVSREIAKMRLKQPGYRMASQDEINKLNQLIAQGKGQTWDHPIARPFTAEPPEDPLKPEQKE